MIQIQTSESYEETNLKSPSTEKFVAKKNWYEIELKKEALNMLIKNNSYNSRINEIIQSSFLFKTNLGYEENIILIKQNLEKSLNRESIEKIIFAFEKNIEEINDIKYGSSSFYKSHNQEREFASQEPWIYHFGRLLSQRGLKEGSQIVDVGINDGEEIGRFPFKTTGVDLSKKAVAKAKQKFPELELMVGNANELTFKSSSFDAYISLRTLCITGVHESKAIDEAYRILKKGGLIVVSFPNVMYDKGDILKISQYNLLECNSTELVEKGKNFYSLLNGCFKDITCYKNGVEDFVCGRK
jgi:ubiquinone/menaquinone biosynthesis C-methylase UbiE